MKVTNPFHPCSFIVIHEVAIVIIRDEEAKAQRVGARSICSLPAPHGPRDFPETAELEGGVGLLKG